MTVSPGHSINQAMRILQSEQDILHMIQTTIGIIAAAFVDCDFGQYQGPTYARREYCYFHCIQKRHIKVEQPQQPTIKIL